MRTARVRLTAISVVAILLLSLGAVLAAGCGGGGKGSYAGAVLDAWSELEEGSEELVQAARGVGEEEDLEDLRDLLADAGDNVDSFQDELGEMKVPSDLEDSHEALEDFLSAYGDYLKAIRRYLDAALSGGALYYTPDLDTPATEAEEALEEYQDSQDYNPAELDRHIWDLPGYLGEAIVDVYGDVIADGDLDDGDGIDDGAASAAMEAIDAWYYHFNQGDGDLMWSLIDPESPMLEDFTYERFVTFVGEAYAGGHQAVYAVNDVYGLGVENGERVEVSLTVDYSAYLDLEGNTVPAHSEDVVIDLVCYRDGCRIYQVFSQSGIW